ncbi:MAG: hypothetical protein RJA70_1686 [Pseudomonadota bacterium]|jgi:penicillin-insensitive murein endopeptidase
MNPTVQLLVTRILPLLLLHSVAIACTTADEAPEPSLSRPGSSDQRDAVSRPQDGSRKAGVTYTINRGGTLIDVANLYKLDPHEVIELNPGIGAHTELGPRTEVVVYRDSRDQSISIGLPHDGAIEGAIPMLDGPGRKITAQRWKTWATRDTVQSLDRVLRNWAEQYPTAPKVLVGNLSARTGGQLSPHKTHQSGRDVDLSYILKWDGKGAVTWQRMSAENLDAELTWALLKLLDKYASIEVIFIDREIQELLRDHAVKHGTIRKGRLAHWLQVANDGASTDAQLQPKIKHVPGHRDHLHVRFACPDGQTRCE